MAYEASPNLVSTPESEPACLDDAMASGGWMTGPTIYGGMRPPGRNVYYGGSVSAGSGTEPKWEDCKSEKDPDKAYALKMAQYFGQKNAPRVRFVHDMMRNSRATYMATHGWSKNTPGYAQGTESVAGAVPMSNHNLLYKPLSILEGEQASSEFRPTAYLTNAAANSRREKAKIETMLARALGPATIANLSVLGIAAPQDHMANQGADPDENMDEWFDKRWRDVYTVYMERLMMKAIKKTRYVLTDNQIKFLCRIMKMSIKVLCVDPETLDSYVPIIDPTMVVWDMDSTDDFFRDQRAIQWLEYPSKEDVLAKYPDVKRKELEEAMLRGNGNWYDLFPAECLKDFTERVMVVHTRWLTTERDVKENGKDYDVYQQAYETTILCGTIVAEHGPMPYQDRSVDSPERTHLQAFVLKPKQSVSPFDPTDIERVQQALKEYNQICAKVQKTILKIASKLGINSDAVPKLGTMTEQQAVEYFVETLQSDDYVILSPSQVAGDGLGSGMRIQDVVSNITVGVPDGFDLTLNRLAMLKQEVYEILGVSDARMGGVGQYATDVTTQQNKQASDYATAGLDIQYRQQNEMLLSCWANVMALTEYEKLKRAKKEKNETWEDSLLMVDSDTLEYPMAKGAIFQDYGIYAELRMNPESVRRGLESDIALGIKMGEANMADLIAAKYAPDPWEAIQEFSRTARRRERDKERQIAAQQQAERDARLEQEQLKGQNAAGLQEQEYGLKGDLSGVETRNHMGLAVANSTMQQAAKSNQQQSPASFRT